MLHMPVLDSERLRIRPLTMDDLDACYELFADAADDGERRAQRRRWLEWTVRSYEQLAGLHQPPYGERAVTQGGTDAFVGVVGLVPSFDAFGRLPSFGGDPGSGRSAEVGLYWALLPSFRGRGYATEAARCLIDFAFRSLDLGRIVATTTHDNEASIAVMRRLGMCIETNAEPEPWSLQVVGVLTPPSVKGA
jgi:RimJ/RimL family protein N-acetyltransferase